MKNWLRTIVAHGLKVEAYEIGQQKVIFCKIPGPVTDIQSVGRVDAGARRGELVGRRHVGGGGGGGE